jgi:hypothetical protein
MSGTRGRLLSAPSIGALLLLLACLVGPSGVHAAGSGSTAKKTPQDAILLSSVQSLTLRGGGAMTAHRRVSAIPQLRCVSSPKLCRLHRVESMRCTNQGAAYGAEDIQWSCTADLPPALKLGSTDVICEGYAGPDDDRVLRGSCGVEYRLALTDEGERQYPELSGSGGGSWGGSSGGGEGGMSPILFWILFIFVLGVIVYSAFFGNQQNGEPYRGARRRPGGGGGGWGGGWGPGGGGGGFGGGGWGDNNNDAPPPYSKYGSSQRQQDGWRPGFWSGAATGAAAGYFAGNRSSRQQQQQRGHGNSGSSSWGGGGSSSSSSSAQYESTGFGGTSRR